MTVSTEQRELELEAGGQPFTVRLYPADRPVGAVLVWAHGGGFLGGSLDMPEADQSAVSQERGFDHGYLNRPGDPAALRTVARFARALEKEGA